jgi:hypothetical protein
MPTKWESRGVFFEMVDGNAEMGSDGQEDQYELPIEDVKALYDILAEVIQKDIIRTQLDNASTEETDEVELPSLSEQADAIASMGYGVQPGEVCANCKDGIDPETGKTCTKCQGTGKAVWGGQLDKGKATAE